MTPAQYHQRAIDRRHLCNLLMQGAEPERIARAYAAVYGSAAARQLSVALLDAHIAVMREPVADLRRAGL